MSTIVMYFVFGLNILLWVVFFIQFKKRYSAQKILNEIEEKVEDLIKQIIREADRSITLIDARRKGLQKLLEEAKRYTELASSELEKKARSQSIMDVLQPKQKKTREKSYSSEPSVLQQNLFFGDMETPYDSLLENQADEVDISEDVASYMTTYKPVTRSTYSMPKIIPAAEPIKIEKDTRTKVLELSAEGFSPELIAAKLEVSITEVQLIIDMYGV